jgi:hypothetical protein
MTSDAGQLPSLVAHADWSLHPQKRWMVCATLRDNGHYCAQAPELAGDPATLVERVRTIAEAEGAVLLGFDFPIGLPLRYAEQAGVEDFMDLLPLLGQAGWLDFYDVTEHPAEIGMRRPFYPRRPGNARQSHLLHALGVESMDHLRRRCDLKHTGRRAASPLFWTLGPQQVGKAAISGWRDVLGPAVRFGVDMAVWPFAGRFFDLLRPGRVVVVETYPAECYGHLCVHFSTRQPGRRSGKRVQEDRRANARRLLDWADAAQVEVDPGLRAAIEDGFGPSADGEDRFDATIGCFGMLNVVLGHQAPGDPDDERIGKIEGWILGQPCR